jgi:exosome complex protein LRP1
MDDLPQDLKDTLAQFDDSIGKLETALDPLFKTKLADVAERLSPQDNAKLNILYAYAINTLFYMFLKTQGVPPNDHPVKAELDRVRNYIKKLKDLSSKKEDGPTMKVDVQASARMINHAIQSPKPSAKEDARPSSASKKRKSPEKVDESDDAQSPNKKRKSPAGDHSTNTTPQRTVLGGPKSTNSTPSSHKKKK